MTNNLALMAFKKIQREGWGLFTPLETMTTLTASTLVQFSQLQTGDTVLDVGCGTGVVAITAARIGAIVSGLDISPQLLAHAENNKQLAYLDIDFKEGDAEELPYSNASFDVVLSQFGHMFATNAQRTMDEMLRVLKPGGTIAFSTWPPEHFVGKLFALTAQYNPPPVTIDPPSQWGIPSVIKDRLGQHVTDLVFDYDVMYFPALSLGHYQKTIEKSLGPVAKLVDKAKDNPTLLEDFRSEVAKLASPYFRDNKIHQIFLLTRAKKIER